MLQLYANVLSTFVTNLSRYEQQALGLVDQAAALVDADDKGKLGPVLELCDGVTDFLYMPATAARKRRLVSLLEIGCTYSELGLQLRFLREAMEDELKSLLIMYMPPAQGIWFYAGDQLLGPSVLARFPGLGKDIDEAGKCLGTGRFTAAVFHLMRVMEVGVQELGTHLGVKLTEEKNWQNILDEVNKAIKALPPKDPNAPQLSSTSANLFNVKLAWRNEVMHPKAEYDFAEAERVVQATKAFMTELAVLV